MPKTPINYSKTYIYKLCCLNPEIKDVYVGHTTDMIRRKAQHKYNCNTANCPKHNFHIYDFIRSHGGWDNWSMILLEQYEAPNRFEAEKRERYWIETLGCNLNMRTPSRKRPERKIFFNCDCGGTYSNYNKNIHFKSNKHTKYIQTQEQEQEQEQTL